MIMPPPNAPFPPVEMRGTSPAVDGNDARSPIPRDEIDSPRAISSTPPGHSSSELPRGDATNLAGRIRKTNSSSARGVANLTPEQLARKRANDRQAQRAIRERTKAQIEALEQKVQELSSQQPYQDLQKAIAEKNAIQAENDNIKKRLVMVMETIQPLLDKPGLNRLNLQSTLKPSPSHPSPMTERYQDTPVSLDSEHHTNESNGSGPTPSPTHPPTTVTPGNRQGLQHIDQPGFPPQIFDGEKPRSGPDNRSTAEIRGERLVLNFLLEGFQHLHIPKINTTQPISEESVSSLGLSSARFVQRVQGTTRDQALAAFSVPIRNIPPTTPLDGVILDFIRERRKDSIEGKAVQPLARPAYPSVSSLLNPEKPSYSISRMFSDVLRTFPDISSLPEQIAVLYMMFLLMQWQLDPTLENYERLPEWYTPRPSQLFTPHPAWVDYIPWPRMRDRVVATYENYPFENYFIPYTTTLSLNWPYEPTDCILHNTDTNELLINPVFERHVRNLNNWSLGPAFVEAFPLLEGSCRILREKKRPSPSPTW